MFASLGAIKRGFSVAGMATQDSFVVLEENKKPHFLLYTLLDSSGAAAKPD